MQQIERCSRCGRIMRESGFAYECEYCDPLPPVEFIGGVAIAKAQPKKTEKKPSYNGHYQKAHIKQTPRLASKEIMDFEPEIDLDRAPLEELIEYKRQIDDKNAELKIQIIQSKLKYTPPEEYRALEIKKIKYGRLSQRIQVAINSRKIKDEKERLIGATDRHKISMEADLERSKMLYRSFFMVAKEMLEPELMQLIIDMANSSQPES